MFLEWELFEWRKSLTVSCVDSLKVRCADMASRYLVIAAHPDDEVLGCGGTMCRMAAEGARVFCLILGEGVTSRDENRDGELRKKELDELRHTARKANALLGVEEVFFASLPDNRFDSVDLLDVIKVVERYVTDLRPEQIFTHFGQDLNKDHQITCQAVLTACRPLPGTSVKGIFSFPVLSSTEWNFARTFRPNYYVDIDSFLETKLEAMKAYSSELREWPHPRSLEAIGYEARLLGAHVGKNAVEAFQVLRWLG